MEKHSCPDNHSFGLCKHKSSATYGGGELTGVAVITCVCGTGWAASGDVWALEEDGWSGAPTAAAAEGAVCGPIRAERHPSAGPLTTTECHLTYYASVMMQRSASPGRILQGNHRICWRKAALPPLRSGSLQVLQTWCGFRNEQDAAFNTVRSQSHPAVVFLNYSLIYWTVSMLSALRNISGDLRVGLLLVNKNVIVAQMCKVSKQVKPESRSMF